jgi:P4 family phage/plasmid primase-like protien
VSVSELRDALEFRYSGCPSTATLEVDTYRDGVFRVRTYGNTERDWNRIAQECDGANYDVWARISVLHERHPTDTRGTEPQTWGTSTLHVDIDPKLDEDETLDQWQGRKLQELESFNPRPSRIESSGRGFYALWKLDSFTTEWGEVKRRNKYLATALGGDDCFDVARILRLPGTLNTKPNGTWAKLVSQNARTYELSDFQEAELSPLELKVQTSPVQSEPVPSTFQAEVESRNPKLWKRIHSESEALDASAPIKSDGSGRVRRYENDMGVACSLLRLKYSPGVVYSVLTHPTWFSGEKWREEGYHDSYPLATVARAIDSVPETPLTNAVQIADKLMQDYDIIYYMFELYTYTDKGVYERGERELRLAIQSITGEKWNPTLRDNVLRNIEERTEVVDLTDVKMVNARNGMLELSTKKLIPHKSAYKSRFQVGAHWNTNADTKDVDRFVAGILPEDAIPVWWMFCGYCLTTEVPLPYRILLAVVGKPRTGKSTLLSALEMFLGEDNVSTVPLTALGGEGDKFTTSSFAGKLLNIDSEADFDVRITRITTLKALASGQPIQLEEKYKKGFRTVLPIKLVFAMNGVPKVSKPDEAFFGRWRILPVREDKPAFLASNPETRLNAQVQLMASQVNRDAWLLRSIEGLEALQEAGDFPEVGSVAEAKGQFRRESDAIEAFLAECTRPVTPEDGPPKWVNVSDLYKAYWQWSQENGEEKWVKTKTYFSQHITNLYDNHQLDVELRKNPQTAIRGWLITYSTLIMPGER